MIEKKIIDQYNGTDASYVLDYTGIVVSPIAITLYNRDDTNEITVTIELRNGTVYSDIKVLAGEQINENYNPINKITITNTNTVEFYVATKEIFV